MAIFPGSAIPSAVSDDYEIENSLRFDGSSSYLRKVNSNDGNKRTWTLSLWAKNSKLDSNQALLYAGADAFEFYFHGDKLKLYVGAVVILETTPVYRDPASWYHIVLAVDTYQGVAADRVKLYVNGNQVTAFNTTNYPSVAAAWDVNSAVQHSIGAWDTDDEFYGGYLAEYYLIDGTALLPSTFGELDSDTNQWKPLDSDDVKDAVTFGTNGFFQKYNSTELAINFTDSAEGHTIEVQGNTHTDTAIKKFGTASAQFDGTGDALSITGTPVGSGTGNWTVECWLYLEGSNSSKYLWDMRNTSFPHGGSPAAPYMYFESSASALTELNCGMSDGTSYSSGTISAANDAWHHIAAVRYNGVYTTYVDGAIVGTPVADTASLSASVDWMIAGRYSDADYITGYVDEFRVSDSARYTGAFDVATSAFTDDSNTKLLMHMDGANDGTVFTDSSTVAKHTITANGHVKNVRGQHHFVAENGHAHLIGPEVGTTVATYDGNDYLECADSTDWDFGTGAFCLEAWIYMGQNVATYNIFSTAAAGDNQGILFYVDGTSGEIEAKIGDGSSWTVEIDSVDNVILPNTWHHVALAREGTGSNQLRIFVDGTNVAEGTYADSDADNNTSLFRIGLWSISGSYWNGYIGPVRVSKGAARYTADFTPPTDVWTNDSDTVLLIQNGTDGTQTFDDLSTSDHTVTAYGDVRWFAPKVGAGAMGFDGTGDYFSIASGTGLEFGTGDFTVEAWVRFSTVQNQGIILLTDAATSNAPYFDYYGGALRFGVYGIAVVNTYTWTPTAHTWYHVAAARSGSTCKLFIDGSEVDSDTNTTDFICDGVLIGAWSSRDWHGYMDMIRVSNVARYTGTFTPPTTAFTDDIKTGLLLNADINEGQKYNPDSSTGLAISTESRIEFDGSTDSLSIPSSSDFNMGDDSWTIDFWVNFKAIPDTDYIFSQWTASGNRWDAYINNNSGTLEWTYQINDASNFQMTMPATSVAIGTWYHVELGVDASTEKGYWYFDGVRQTESSSWTHTNPNVDAAFYIFNPGPNINVALGINGYMDEFRVSKGIIRHTGATFTPETRGNPYTADSYTKLLIHSDYTGGLGADSSGNFNNFTATNLAATDQVLDSPTNNFATLNPLQTNGTLSEGNLKCATTTTQKVGGIATIAPQSGKWYWEGYLVSYINSPVWMFGVTGRPTEDWRNDYAVGSKSWSYSYDCSTGVAYNNDATVPEANPYGATATTGDIIGIALDLENYELYFSKNGTWQNSADPASDTGGIGMTTPNMQANTSYELNTYVFATGDGSATKGTTQVMNFGQDSSFAGAVTAQGNQDGNDKGDFYYEPPSGYLALCTDNLSAPEIKLPGENFNTLLWTGDGAASRSITGLGFQADMMWSKIRTETHQHNLVDRVRGVDQRLLMPNSNGAEDTTCTHGWFDSLDSDGWSMTYAGGGWNVNTDTEDYVGWAWKKSATAGFDIVAYTGNGVARTISHSLGVVPDLIIIKGRDVVEDWLVGSVQQGLGTGRMYLSTNAATSGSYAASLWNSTAATASVFSVGDSSVVNTNTKLYIAYLFANIDGFSKISSYKGNGATTGPFVYTGFKPKFVIAKNMDLADDWEIYDGEMTPYNYLDLGLKPNTSGAQYALNTNNRAWDFLSNGFKVRGSNGGINQSGDNILYIAFAESPVKYSNAR